MEIMKYYKDKPTSEWLTVDRFGLSEAVMEAIKLNSIHGPDYTILYKKVRGRDDPSGNRTFHSERIDLTDVRNLALADASGNVILSKMFGGFLCRSEDGHFIAICCRDGSFEINVLPKDHDENTRNWHRVDMATGQIMPNKPAEVVTKFHDQQFYYLWHADESDPVLVQYYCNPDTKQWGFGFNIHDGGGFLPADELTTNTKVTPVQVLLQRRPASVGYADATCNYAAQRPASAISSVTGLIDGRPAVEHVVSQSPNYGMFAPAPESQSRA